MVKCLALTFSMLIMLTTALAVSVPAVKPSEFYHRRGGRIEGFSIIGGSPPKYKKQTDNSKKKKNSSASAGHLAKQNKMLMDKLASYEGRITATERKLAASEVSIKTYY